MQTDPDAVVEEEIIQITTDVDVAPLEKEDTQGDNLQSDGTSRLKSSKAGEGEVALKLQSRPFRVFGFSMCIPVHRIFNIDTITI